MNAKRASKATRPPCLPVFIGITASTAGAKNWGRGKYLLSVIDKFGMVSNDHKMILNKLQVQCIYNWYRVRSDRVKIQRASAKKKFQKTQARRAKHRETYSKNCDKPTTTKTTKKRNISKQQPPAKKQKTAKKYVCSRCTKTYTYKGPYETHIAEEFKVCKKQSK